MNILIKVIIVKNVKWYDAHYRKLQIFDLSRASRYSAIFVDKWEDRPNYMLRHEYFSSLSSMNRNIVKDLIGDSDGFLPIIDRSGTFYNLIIQVLLIMKHIIVQKKLFQITLIHI